MKSIIAQGDRNRGRRLAIYVAAWSVGYLLQQYAGEVAGKLAPVAHKIVEVAADARETTTPPEVVDLDAIEVDPAQLRSGTAFDTCAICDHDRFKHATRIPGAPTACRECTCYEFVELEDAAAAELSDDGA
jgi:hypothetical protein